MSLSGTQLSSEASRKDRRRRNSLLLAFAIGALVFGAAGYGLIYALRPATLRIAVGPPGSDDDKVIQALAQALVSDSKTIRLCLISSDGSPGSLALLEAGKADLAAGRGDLEMLTDVQIVATLRKNSWCCGLLLESRAKTTKGSQPLKSKKLANLLATRSA